MSAPEQHLSKHLASTGDPDTPATTTTNQTNKQDPNTTTATDSKKTGATTLPRKVTGKTIAFYNLEGVAVKSPFDVENGCIHMAHFVITGWGNKAVPMLDAVPLIISEAHNMPAPCNTLWRAKMFPGKPGEYAGLLVPGADVEGMNGLFPEETDLPEFQRINDVDSENPFFVK